MGFSVIILLGGMSSERKFWRLDLASLSRHSLQVSDLTFTEIGSSHTAQLRFAVASPLRSAACCERASCIASAAFSWQAKHKPDYVV